MSTHAEQTSIRHSVVVEAPQERAFRVFVEQFDRIKPREHNMLGVDIAESVFEPRAGGRVYDRGVDGSECQWARVLAYDPPERLVFTWGWEDNPVLGGLHLPPGSSRVEVLFEPDGDGTILRLRHSGLRTEPSCQFHSWGWEVSADRLVLVAEGRDPGPDPFADL